MTTRVLARALAVVASSVAFVAGMTPLAHASGPTVVVTAYSGAHSAPDTQAVPLTITFSGMLAAYVNPVVTFVDASAYQSQAQAIGTAGVFDATTGSQTVTATVDFAAAADGGVPAAPGTATIEVCESDCVHVSSPVHKNIGKFLLTASRPAVTSVSPDTLGGNAKRTITVTGGNFARGATVTFGGPTTIVPADVKVVDANHITGLVDLSNVAGGDPTGGYTPTVTNLDGQDGTGGSLTLTPPPTVAALSVPDLGQNAAGYPFTIRGAHFHNPTVSVVHDGNTSDFAVSVDHAVSDSSTIHATLTGVASTTSDAVLTVMNDDGGSYTESVPVAAPPTLTSLSPSALGRGASGVDVVVHGTGFVAGDLPPAVDLGSGVTHDAITQVSGTAVTVPGAAVSSTATTGGRTFTLVNGDGARRTSPASALTIDVAPVITGATPTAFAKNSGAHPVTLTGSGFQSGMAVLVQGPQTVAVPATVANAGSATISLDTNTLSTGGYSLAPENPDHGTSAAFNAVEVENFVLGSVTPGGVNNGGTSTTSLTVKTSSGSFPSPTTGYVLTLTPKSIPGQDPITSTVGVVSGTGSDTWTGDVDLSTASPGTYAVSVTDGSNSGSCACVFTVGQAHAPAIDSGGVIPSAIAQAATRTVTITGSGFTSGDSVTLQRTSGAVLPTTAPVAGLTVSGIHVSGVDADGLADQLTFTLTAAPDVTTGAVDVVVNESGGGPASNVCSACLTVDPEPALTGLDKTGVGQNASGYQVVVSGSNLPTTAGTGSYVFATGAGDDAGVSVTSVSGTPSSVTLVIDVSTGAELGAHSLRVENSSDGGSAVLDNALTVDAPPTPTSLQPSVVAPGATSVPVSLDGSDFAGPVTLTSPVATFTNVTLNGSTITATASIAGDAVEGTAYDVTVANADGGRGTCSCLFVAVPPSWSAGQALDVTSSDSALDVSWPAPADDGGAPVTGFTATLTPSDDSEAQQVATVGVDGDGGGHVPFAGLVNGETYDLSVTAANMAGTSDLLTGSGVPFTVPGAPTDLSVAPDDSSLTVSWSAPVDDGGDPVSGYRVSVTPAGGNTISYATDAATTSQVFLGLTNGVAYAVRAVAINAAGHGPAATSSGTPRTTPGAPTSVTVVPHDSSLAVSWVASGDDGGDAVASYTVSVVPHAGGSPVTFTTADGSTTSHSFGSLTNGTLYDVSVVATNAAGDGPAATSSGTPRTTPGAPTAVVATPADGRASVAWSAPVTTGGSAVTGYTVTVSPGGQVFTAAPTATSIVVGGLTNGTVYTFAVRARNVAGPGPAATATATPRFATALTIADSAASVVDGGAVTLSGVLARSNGVGVPGATITLYRRVDSGTVAVLTAVTTDATGHWSLALRPTADATFVAVFAGDSADRPAVSPAVGTVVAPLVRVAAASPSGLAKPLVVTGSVAPGKAGRTVRLYSVDRSGRLHLLASTALGRHSAYRFAVRLHRGLWRLRVVIGATPGNVAGHSATLRVRRV